MDCRRPQILELPYMLTGSPSAGTDRYVLANFPADRDEIAAIEIDCSSEVDCCVIAHAGGFAYVSVGSPALGPFTGPILVQPWRRVMPFSSDGQGYSIEPLATFPPKLSLKIHFQIPPVFQMRRSPAIRTAADLAVGAGYSAVAEFPLFGRKTARILLTNGGVNSLTYKVTGKQYSAKDGSSERQDNPIGSNATAISGQLVLDGSGSLELAVATLVTVSVTFVDEPWDTLLLSAKSAAGSTVSNPTYQTNGEL